MFLKRRIVKNKHPKVKYTEYLNHEDEPKRFKNYSVPSDVKDELMANRYFLKRRVWKNMEKIRRSNILLDKRPNEPKEPKSKVLRPRQAQLPSSP